MGQVFLIAGARPNFMKVAPLLRALKVDGRLVPRLVHTGQHYDPVLSDRIMSDLGIPTPDHYLGVGSDTPSRQTARILEMLDELLEEHRPEAVIVVGDVTSTCAAALAAQNREIPVAHVEAGLRSRDWSMPEERNRVVVDSLSDWLFVTEPSGVANLERENVRGDVHMVGNVMIDSLLQVLAKAKAAKVSERLGLAGRPYSVLTLHRPGNVDTKDRFAKLFAALAPVAKSAPMVFPVHPRTRAAIEALDPPEGVTCVDPLGYVEFVSLVAGSSLVLTDSGGLQEETTVLGVPCLTLRPNTERPVTIDIGTNELVDCDAERIAELGARALAGDWKSHRRPHGWDGRAADRIALILGDAIVGPSRRANLMREAV